MPDVMAVFPLYCTSLSVLLQWILDLEAWKSSEIAIVCAKRGAVFNRQRRQMSVHD
jgi:hypothetical protein